MCVCVQQLNAWAELCACGCGCCREGKGQLQLQPMRPHNVQETKTETAAAEKNKRERDKTGAKKRKGRKMQWQQQRRTGVEERWEGEDNKHTVKCENAQFAFPSFAAKSVRNVREREKASPFLYTSLYLCVCVCVICLFIRRYKQISQCEVAKENFQKLPKGKQRKILKSSLSLEMELKRSFYSK